MNTENIQEIIDKEEEVVNNIAVIKQNRFTSKAAWVAITSLLLLAGNAFHLWEMIGVTNEFVQGLINFILAVLAAAGIFNDPTSKNQF